jgi:hypothetical protein
VLNEKTIGSRGLRYIFIIAGVVFLCNGTGAEDEGSKPFVVSSLVESKVIALTKGYQPTSQLARLVRSSEVSQKVSLGKSTLSEAYSTFVLQTNGLWATEFGSTSGGRSFSLSLCGLVNVTSTGIVSLPQENTFVAPIGKIFVPFGFRTTTGFTRLERLLDLIVSTNDVCSPQPGMEFSYKRETEVITKPSGLFGRTQAITEIEEVVCKVASQEKIASQALPQFRGTYLDVVCDHKQASLPVVQRSLIFLRESGMYLMVGLRESWGQARITYKEAQFSN